MTARDRLTDAELQIVLDRLGLTAQDFAALVGVPPKRAKRWLSGKDPVPLYVGTRAEALEEES